MWWLYLDESGDLGFDFITKKPSNFFTIAILLVKGHERNRALIKATQTTIRRKLSHRPHAELKGSHTGLAVKRYWFQRVQPVPFQVYALTLKKRRVYPDLQGRKDRLYNFIARQVMDRLPIEQAHRNAGHWLAHMPNNASQRSTIRESDRHVGLRNARGFRDGKSRHAYA